MLSKKTDTPLRAVAYYRVSTEEQSIDQQRDLIADMVKYKGWDLVGEFSDEGYSGSKEDRAGLQQALAMIGEKKAEILVVTKLDRLTRSSAHFMSLMRRSHERGWHLAIRDLDLDTTNPFGKFAAMIFAQVAELEVELIRQRTKEALAAKKKRGIIGGRKAVPPAVADRINRRRLAGHTYQMIADELNDAGVATAQGGAKWRSSSVRSVAIKYAKTED